MSRPIDCVSIFVKILSKSPLCFRRSEKPKAKEDEEKIFSRHARGESCERQDGILKEGIGAFALDMLATGMSVQEILGRASVTTMAIYTEVPSLRKEETLQRCDLRNGMGGSEQPKTKYEHDYFPKIWPPIASSNDEFIFRVHSGPPVIYLRPISQGSFRPLEKEIGPIRMVISKSTF